MANNARYAGLEQQQNQVLQGQAHMYSNGYVPIVVPYLEYKQMCDDLYELSRWRSGELRNDATPFIDPGMS